MSQDHIPQGPPSSNPQMTPSDMEQRDSGIIAPSGTGKEILVQREWEIIKMVQATVAVSFRQIMVDAILASTQFLNSVNKGTIVHFDEVLERLRKPVQYKIYYVTLKDKATGKVLELELNKPNTTEEDVLQFVAGLNAAEQVVMSLAQSRVDLRTSPNA